MTESIKEWAQAGDPSAMFKLAEIYLEKGEVEDAKRFLAQAAEKNYLPAASKFAEIFQGEDNLPQAVKFYKQAALRGDVEAMESLVELCPADKEILDFVLEIIDKLARKRQACVRPVFESRAGGLCARNENHGLHVRRALRRQGRSSKL